MELAVACAVVRKQKQRNHAQAGESSFEADF